jgi:hypothetical protein
MLLVLPVIDFAGGTMKKPWYIQAIFGAGCFGCLAFLGIAPFASSKADKALMDFIGAALFAAAFLVVLIYNLIKSGTFLPGLKRDTGVTLENPSSGVADKQEASRVTTIIGLFTIMLLAYGAVQIAKYKQLPVSTYIPFDLMIMGTVAVLIRIRFRKRQQKDS